MFGHGAESTLSGNLPTMAYVVGRSDGRFEIRESVNTERGPRARSLATFRVLDDRVLDHAQSRAGRPFDRRTVIERARARGASYEPQDPGRLAAQLVRALAAGATVPETIAAALQLQMTAIPASMPDSVPPMLDWMAASPADRGEALRDLLRMTDRLPPPRRREARRFPLIHSAPA